MESAIAANIDSLLKFISDLSNFSNDEGTIANMLAINIEERSDRSLYLIRRSQFVHNRYSGPGCVSSPICA